MLFLSCLTPVKLDSLSRCCATVSRNPVHREQPLEPEPGLSHGCTLLLENRISASRNQPRLPGQQGMRREDYEDLLLLLTSKELFVLALQHNYRSCKKTAPNCWFNN